MRRVHRSLSGIFLLLGLGLLPCGAAAQSTIEPEPRQWRIEPALDNRKEAENLSGAACTVGGARTCLLISDEASNDGRYARFATIEDTRLIPGRTLQILPDNLVDETDAEAVDFDGDRFYVTGSHGVSRGGAYQVSRFVLYRFPVDANGPAHVERIDRLEALIASVPELRPFACARTLALQGQCRRLEEDGVNIEGLAVRDGRVFLGFRAPVVDGSALVLSVAAEPLFSPGTPEARVHRLALGSGVGIRDLARVANGFLVLGGSSRPEPRGESGPAPVFFWAGDNSAPRVLGVLGGVAPGDKPEAILVLDEDAAGWRVLVLSDEPIGGKPTEYRVPR